MHPLNRAFWDKVAAAYPVYFDVENSRILEVGSLNVNGSIRESIGKGGGEYIGIDWRAGPNVDAISLASRMSFDQRFDAVVSASMLEHDPEWQLSLVNIVSHMKEDGILCLSWGAALNGPHCHETAIDGHFHPRPAGQVISLLEHLGLYIHFFRYEGRLRKTERDNLLIGDKPLSERPGMGEVCLIAFKNKAYAKGEEVIDELFQQDDLGWKDTSDLPQAGVKQSLKGKRAAMKKARR